MADTSGIQTVQGRIQNLSQLLAAAQAQATPNTARITDLQERLAKQQQELTLRRAKNQEIMATRALANAQLGYQNAQYNQQIGTQKVAQEGDLLENERSREQMYRDLIADFGARDMTRSGVYQEQVAEGEESSVLQRAQIIREYNNTIMGLEAARMAGANEVALNRAAQIAQIRAAYAMARLNASVG